MATSVLRVAPLAFLRLRTRIVATFYEKRHGKLQLMILVSILALNNMFRTEMIWVNLIFILLQLLLLPFFILLKY